MFNKENPRRGFSSCPCFARAIHLSCAIRSVRRISSVATDDKGFSPLTSLAFFEKSEAKNFTNGIERNY